ncbi:putative undecaprenyl diphosphate synthase-domain-containing protein [Lentinula edodes]|uniref:putative undecaprenyl diphosphate synthase-domain-containing protein n=1 Tax=Lentinula edodes TaxID=5353 RepID=UPI001E8EDF5D|nr:putative undecaprenyl diphosphate synthase-domain-containing protein [Lentinula edodes]KAH7876570.1 putative undecaprenyl diphosphate synthase-domain-containing protein [Lentinula edodes]
MAKPFTLVFLLSILYPFQWILAKLRITRLAQRSLLHILAAGSIPRHVGFVMDGNRRYARGKGKLVQEGHGDGYLALRRVLEICLRLNIRCVSVYAFAIDNFKRPQEEVTALMQLAESKLMELCSHGDLLQEYGVKLNVIGRRSLFPESVQAAVRKAEELTEGNNRSILNVCMPYSSRDEITTAVEDCIREVLAPANDFMSCEISEDTINSHLMSVKQGSPPLDILVRTSGVKRLSDFMLWQCCENTQLHFSNTYWPDFGLFDFVPIILEWQRSVWFRRQDVWLRDSHSRNR